MRMRRVMMLLAFSCICFECGCSVAPPPGIKPPGVEFITNSLPPDAVDHGIYADPGLDFIVLEWNSDPSKQTTGYELYRSLNDTLGSDGLLRDRSQIARIESPNQLFEPLDTSYIDSIGSKIFGVPAYYQVRAYNTSTANVRTFSDPSHVGWFALIPKPTINTPSGDNANGDVYSWNDAGSGGKFQIIVRNATTQETMWSSGYLFEFSGGSLSNFYNSDGTGKPLVPGVSYQWRVKKLGDHTGSSSAWQNFSIK